MNFYARKHDLFNSPGNGCFIANAYAPIVRVFKGPIGKKSESKTRQPGYNRCMVIQDMTDRRIMKRSILLAVFLALAPLLFSQPLRMLPPSEQGWRRIDLGAAPDKVIALQASTNLLDWRIIGVAHDGLFGYADPMSAALQNRFYRTLTSNRTLQNDFKNQIFQRQDPFLTDPTFGDGDIMNEIRWIKFIITAEEPGRVYFQDSVRYPFHYPFAAARLPLFQGMPRAEFDAKTLHLAGQKAVLGAILFPPEWQVGECGVQFAGLDPYPPERIVEWIRWVQAAMVFNPPLNIFYMPSSEQSGSAQAHASYLASNGVHVASAERWGGVNNVYSEGWAIGRLVFVPASEINAAYEDGRLHAADILLTDTVPAETPYVAGILTMSPSTPNSHVSILSRSFGTPFAYISSPGERERIRALAGSEIVFRASSGSSGEVRAFAQGAGMDPTLKSDLLAMKKPGRLAITPKARFGSYSTNTDGLYPSDIRYFGGKAANYGLLRRTLPTNSLRAVAFSFDLWDDFMEQTVAGGKSLRAEISSRLDKYVYPPDVGALKADLAGVRDSIEKSCDFSATQRQAITNALAAFDSGKKIRIRSSTNVEDSEAFTGAGLYDSYSGCLLDDQDADDGGPCHCDPNTAKEQGVFRAMRKAYASFYNDNAFMERLRLGVEEGQAGMALLVHHSFPDEDEWANGVATMDYSKDYQEIELVTQVGAFSVTNPDGNSRPEVIVASYYTFGGPYYSTKSPSSLVPLGAKVMAWETDYTALCQLIRQVSAGYQKIYPAKSSFMLDLEYKKINPGKLILKQVRTLPRPAVANAIPALLGEPCVYAILQGETSDPLAKHRLKARLVLSGKNVRLNGAGLSQCVWDDVQYEYVENGRIKTLSGALPSFAKASHRYETNDAYTTIADRWELGEGDETRTMTLRAEISDVTFKNASQPLLVAGDFRWSLETTYSKPKPGPFYGGLIIDDMTVDAGAKLIDEYVALVPWPVRTPTSLLQHRSIACPDGIQIETSFYWPQPPRGATAGYTAPLVEWVETRITGIGAEPIVLHGYYAQTYSPGHHNFTDTFIFEPRLEPGISPSIREALAQADIRLLAVSVGMGNASAEGTYIQGISGIFRALKTK
jgi:hypothetical protein